MPIDSVVIAAVIQEGSRLLTEVLRLQRASTPSIPELTLESIGLKRQELDDAYEQSLIAPLPFEPVSLAPKVIVTEKAVAKQNTDEYPSNSDEKEVAVKAKSIESGCLPCALGHFGTCSGLLNEAVRFSDNGMDDVEVVDRLNACLDEFNAMERIDLRPEKIRTLPEWERKVAERALKSSRATRHKIEGCRTKEDLVNLAADTQTVRKDIGKEWFQTKIREFSPEDKAAIAQRVIKRLETLEIEDSVE